MENIRELYKGWSQAKLVDVCEILDSFRKPINSSEREKRIVGKKDNELYPYFGATGQVGQIDHYLLDGEFVLLGEDGAPFLDSYKNKAYIAKGKIWVNNHVHILKALILNRYLLHYLNQFNYKEYVTGTTRLKLNQSSMKEIPVPIAPLPEQHRIVAKIEELFSELDKGIENLKAAQQQLKVYRQAVLKWAFEGKLTEEWRNKQQNLNDAGEVISRIILERKNKEIQKGKFLKPMNPISKMEFSRLGDLPETWMFVKLGQISTVATGATPLKSKKEYYENGIIPWVTSSALNKEYVVEAPNKVTELALKETNLKIFPKHSLLVAMYGEGKTRGKCSELLIDATTNQAIAAIVLEETAVDIKTYLKYYLIKNYNDIRRQSSGGVQPNINLDIVKNLVVPLPSLQEQAQIIQEIESRLSVCDKLEESIEHSFLQAEVLRQSILKKAFEGRLVPQDPNDEPAEILLEKICAEREAQMPEKKTARGRTKK